MGNEHKSPCRAKCLWIMKGVSSSWWLWIQYRTVSTLLSNRCKMLRCAKTVGNRIKTVDKTEQEIDLDVQKKHLFFSLVWNKQECLFTIYAQCSLVSALLKSSVVNRSLIVQPGLWLYKHWHGTFLRFVPYCRHNVSNVWLGFDHRALGITRLMIYNHMIRLFHTKHL